MHIITLLFSLLLLPSSQKASSPVIYHSGIFIENCSAEPTDSITVIVYVHFEINPEGEITHARVDSMTYGDHPIERFKEDAIQSTFEEALGALNDLPKLKTRFRENTSFTLPMRIKQPADFFLKPE